MVETEGDLHRAEFLVNLSLGLETQGKSRRIKHVIRLEANVICVKRFCLVKKVGFEKNKTR